MDSPAFTCLICDAEFISNYALEVHTSRLHTGVDTSDIPNQHGMYESIKPLSPPISLPDTSSTTVSNVAFKTASSTYACKFCPETFAGKLDRFLHIVKIHKCSQPTKVVEIDTPTTFVCTQCNKEFPSPHSLRVHIGSHKHNITEIERTNENGRFSCKYCDRDFKSTKSRNIHFGKVHGVGRRKLYKTEKEARFSRHEDRALKPTNGLSVTVDREVTLSVKVEPEDSEKDINSYEIFESKISSPSSVQGEGMIEEEKEVSPPSSVHDEGKNEEEMEIPPSSVHDEGKNEEEMEIPPSSVQDGGKNEEEKEMPPPSSAQDEDTSTSTSDADKNVESISSTSTSDDAAMVCAEETPSTNVENVDQAQSVSQQDEIEKNDDQPPKSTSSHSTLLQEHSYSDSATTETELVSTPEPENPFKCRLCDKSFQIVYSLNAHMKVHSSKSPAQKVGASPKTRTLPTLVVPVTRRQLSKFKDSPKSSSTLNKEAVDQSPQPEDVGKEPQEPASAPEQLLYECWYCDKSFRSVYSRAAHLKIHYANGSARKVYPRPYTSPTYVIRRTRPLSKQKKRRRKSLSDISSWTRSKTFRCLLCPKILLTSAALASHVKTHEIVDEPSPKTLQSAPSPSPSCPTPTDLMEGSTSLQVRLFRLPIIPMNDKRKQQTPNANVDVAKKEPEVWFCCGICDRKFTTRRGYARHMWCCKAKVLKREKLEEPVTAKVNTDPVVVELNEEEEFVCDTCDLAFERRKDLSEHVRGHVSSDPLLSEDSLANGERTATVARNDSFSCLLCDRQFAAQRNLNTHMFKKHNKRKGLNGYSPVRKSSPARSSSVMQTRKRTPSPVNGAKDQEENESAEDFEGWATKRPRQSLLMCKEALKQYYTELSQSEVVEQQCHLCGLCFRSAVALKKHVEAKCDTNGASKNDGDENVVEDDGTIKQEFTGNKSALGEFFDDSNTENYEEKIEMENIANVGPFSCCCCFKKFACESDVRTHENQPEILLFCCGICSLYFINTAKAKQHSMIHTRKLSN